MLAHGQGGPFNASELARSLDVSATTVGRHLDLLCGLMLVRRLRPWTSRLGKRLAKTPRVYIRDSGVAHALLGIATADDLLSHPASGGSWEGFVIENLTAAAPMLASTGFYRSRGGAEIGLVIESAKAGLWAVEIRRGSVPRVSRGFRAACEDLRPDRMFVVHGGRESFPLPGGVEALSLREMTEKLSEI